MPYSATPNLWWLLLKRLLKFFMDMIAPTVARSTAIICWIEIQKYIYHVKKENGINENNTLDKVVISVNDDLC